MNKFKSDLPIKSLFDKELDLKKKIKDTHKKRNEKTEKIKTKINDILKEEDLSVAFRLTRDNYISIVTNILNAFNNKNTQSIDIELDTHIILKNNKS